MWVDLGSVRLPRDRGPPACAQPCVPTTGTAAGLTQKPGKCQGRGDHRPVPLLSAPLGRDRPQSAQSRGAGSCPQGPRAAVPSRPLGTLFSPAFSHLSREKPKASRVCCTLNHTPQTGASCDLGLHEERRRPVVFLNIKDVFCIFQAKRYNLNVLSQTLIKAKMERGKA